MDLFDYCIALCITFTLLTVLLLAFEHGLLDRYQSIRQLRRMLNMVLRAIEFWIQGQQNRAAVNVVMNSSSLSMSINYTVNGEMALINIPYDKDKSRRMRMWRVFLIPSEGNPIPITQAPGIPYMCSAKMLGGKEIIARHSTDNSKILRFDSEVVPGWLDLS